MANKKQNKQDEAQEEQPQDAVGEVAVGVHEALREAVDAGAVDPTAISQNGHSEPLERRTLPVDLPDGRRYYIRGLIPVKCELPGYEELELWIDVSRPFGEVRGLFPDDDPDRSLKTLRAVCPHIEGLCEPNPATFEPYPALNPADLETYRPLIDDRKLAQISLWVFTAGYEKAQKAASAPF